MRKNLTLRRWMLKNGFTINSLAQAIGIGRANVWRWVKGKSIPRASSWLKLKSITKDEFEYPDELKD